MTIGLIAYKGLTSLIAPAVPLLLSSRVKKGKEDPARLNERKGYASRKRPEGRLIWLHGASIGESQVLLLLFEALKKAEPDLNGIITTQTLTSADLVARRNPDGLIHQMAPLDTPFAVKRFLDHWRPDLAMFAEGDVWPNMITRLDKRKTPRMLVNARMTQKSFDGWLRFQGLAKKLFGGFEPILAANQRTADHLNYLTRKRVRRSGNIKYAAAPLPADETDLGQFREIIAGRPVFAALSTHPGEEAIVRDAWAKISAGLDKPAILMIAPRHPERGTEIVSVFADRSVYQRSFGGLPDGGSDIWVCDTLGELGLWMRLADVVFLGGGLPGAGIFGHNPIEPLKLERHVLSFPEVDNFAIEFRDMIEAGAASYVESAADLADKALPYLKGEIHFEADLSKLKPYLLGDEPLLIARDAALNALKTGRRRR